MLAYTDDCVSGKQAVHYRASGVIPLLKMEDFIWKSFCQMKRMKWNKLWLPLRIAPLVCTGGLTSDNLNASHSLFTPNPSLVSSIECFILIMHKTDVLWRTLWALCRVVCIPDSLSSNMSSDTPPFNLWGCPSNAVGIFYRWEDNNAWHRLDNNPYSTHKLSGSYWTRRRAWLLTDWKCHKPQIMSFVTPNCSRHTFIHKFHLDAALSLFLIVVYPLTEFIRNVPCCAFTENKNTLSGKALPHLTMDAESWSVCPR